MGGREVKRVPMTFAWPLGQRWVGYTSYVPCPKCKAYINPKKCKECCGEMQTEQRVEPPEGDGWQLWEVTSEGAPVSPVFATSDELAAWCASGATFFGEHGGTADDWRKFIAGHSYRMDLRTGSIKWSPKPE